MQLSLSRLIIAFLLLAAMVFLFLFNPESTNYLPCIFKKITGLQCPGCGSARACYHLLHGNFLTAIDYNLLLVCFIPFLLIECIRWFGPALKSQFLRMNIKSYYVLIIVILFWVIRNLPFYPFIKLSSDY